jgi:hypothetical protein
MPERKRKEGEIKRKSKLTESSSERGEGRGN